MSRIYAILVLLALCIGFTAIVPTITTTAQPVCNTYYVWIKIVDQDGNPIKGQKVTVVLFNETGEKLMHTGTYTTNETGHIDFTVCIVEPMHASTYNFTIYWQDAVGQWYVLVDTISIAAPSGGTVPTVFTGTIFNVTLQALWMSVKMQALGFIDLNGNGIAEPDEVLGPLVYMDPENPDRVLDRAIVVFKNETTREEIFRVEVNNTGWMKEWFNATNTMVWFDYGWHEDHTAPPTYVVEVWWGHGAVCVANQTWTFTAYDPTVGPPEVFDYKYGITALVRLGILDCHGELIDYIGDTEVKAYFEYKDTIVRGARFTSYAIAPVIGKNYTNVMWFWVPVWDEDPTDLASGTIKYKVEIFYLRYPVCDADFVINSTDPVIEEYMTTTLVPVVFVVKDYQKPMQPKEGVLVTVVGGPWTEVNPWKAYTLRLGGTEVAALTLPPYERVGEEYFPIYYFTITINDVNLTAPGGYLPADPYGTVYTFNATYEPVPGAVVTKSTTVVLYNCTYYIGTNYLYVWLGMYHVKLRAYDLCDQPIDPYYTLARWDADAKKWVEGHNITSVLLYDMEGRPVVSSAVKEGGYIVLYDVPAGLFTIKIRWKNFWLEGKDPANITQTFILNVTGNIQEAIEVVFPIRNIAVTLVKWDDQPALPIEGLNVTIEYGPNLREWNPDTKSPWFITNKTGMVAIKKVPAGIEVGKIVAYTSCTPYIRPEDINLKVLDVSLKAIPANETCTWTEELRTWIYSMHLSAVDCTGEPLTSVTLYNTTSGEYITYNVTVLLDEERGWYCGACYDFRIINRTAEFPVVWTANQSKTYPHLFVAGAEYTIKVFYAGTLVYNYTIKLPVPNGTHPDFFGVEYFNSTDMKVYVPGEPYTVPEFNITYPKIVEIEPSPPGEKPTIKLFTWVWPFKFYTTTVSGVEGYLVPNVRIEFNVSGLLNATFIHTGAFEDLADDTETGWTFYTLAFYNYTDDYGETTIRIPAWTYRISGGKYIRHENDIAIGTKFEDIFLRGIVDHFVEYYNETRTTPGFVKTYNNTIINWNGTAVETDPTYYPYKGFNWNKTVGLGYCGGFILLPTTGMECFVADAVIPSELVAEYGLPESLERKCISVYIGDTFLTEGCTEDYTPVKFEPELDGTKTLPNGTVMTVIEPGTPEAYYIEIIEYTLETDLSYYLETFVEPYGLAVEDVFMMQPLEVTLTFTIDNNCGKTPVKVTWAAFVIKVLDWAGMPLNKMTVFAVDTATGRPVSVGVSRADGIAFVFVAGWPAGTYYIDIYWRDTYFLEAAGVIPKSMNIWASSIDEEALWRVWNVTGGGIVHREIKTYAYKGQLKLLKADGTPLSADIVPKITVTIEWPDGVVTEHKPDTDGTVKIVLNKDTVVSWPADPSSAYNPESPAGQPQTPPGAYTITITWEGVPEPIYEGTITIERAKTETPLLIFKVKTAVYDLNFKATTPFGTPLAAAEMEITKTDGTKVTVSTDAEGAATVTEVPLGKATITKVVWKGTDITEYGVEPAEITLETTAVTVKGVGRLTVKVTGAFGQPDTETVKITGPITKTVRVEGSWSEEVPAGSYTVAGKSVSVAAGEEAVVTITTGRVFGWPLSTILMYIIGIIILVAIIAILIYEYTSWRYTRKIAKAITPAKTPK